MNAAGLTVFEPLMLNRFSVSVCHGSPAAVRQIFNVLHIFSTFLQNGTQQTTETSKQRAAAEEEISVSSRTKINQDVIEESLNCLVHVGCIY